MPRTLASEFGQGLGSRERRQARAPVTELARVRRVHGILQRELARALGVSPATLSGVENGWRAPWPRLRADCARIFDVSEEALFPPDERLRR